MSLHPISKISSDELKPLIQHQNPEIQKTAKKISKLVKLSKIFAILSATALLSASVALLAIN